MAEMYSTQGFLKLILKTNSMILLTDSSISCTYR